MSKTHFTALSLWLHGNEPASIRRQGLLGNGGVGGGGEKGHMARAHLENTWPDCIVRKYVILYNTFFALSGLLFIYPSLPSYSLFPWWLHSYDVPRDIKGKSPLAETTLAVRGNSKQGNLECAFTISTNGSFFCNLFFNWILHIDISLFHLRSHSLPIHCRQG